MRRLLGWLVAVFLVGSGVPIFAQVTKIDLNQNIYYDASGLIVHKRPDGTFDGGDTAQREG